MMVDDFKIVFLALVLSVSALSMAGCGSYISTSEESTGGILTPISRGFLVANWVEKSEHPPCEITQSMAAEVYPKDAVYAYQNGRDHCHNKLLCGDGVYAPHSHADWGGYHRAVYIRIAGPIRISEND